MLFRSWKEKKGKTEVVAGCVRVCLVVLAVK